MNEPKRRGRPPKAKPPETERFLSHLDELSKSHPEYIAELNEPAAEMMKPMGVVVPGKDALVTAYEAAQAYALRVWSGQSPDVPRPERIRRVQRALEGQNLPFEGVELP